jgi:hypothetical protein
MGSDVEQYIAREAGVGLAKVFDQYLRTTMVPALEYRIERKTLSYRWADVVPGFDMPVEVKVSAGRFARIHPTESWQTVPVELDDPADFAVDPDWYVIPRDDSAEPPEEDPATR